MKTKAGIYLVPSLVLVCETLQWDDGWEFDRPSMMLAPVIRCFEDASSHERIVESVLMDGVITGVLKSEDFEKTWGWRGYKLPVLRRRFKESMAGKRFPIAGYFAQRETVRIILDEHGDLAWEKIPEIK